MGADPLDERAQECGDCGLHAPIVTKTIDILSRLAPGLWNVTPPTQETTPELEADDVVDDTTIFGPTGSDDVTPQFELARNFRLLKDMFITGWRQMEANQLALGNATIENNQVIGQGTYARGADLDRWVQQFGVARPNGFTDCCLWRLLLLLLFQPGNATWLLREIALLYTGVRPMAIQSRSKIILQWPASPLLIQRGGTFCDFDAFADRTAIAGTETPPGPTPLNALFAGLGVSGTLDAYGRPIDGGGAARAHGDGYAGDAAARLTSPGLMLAQALALARAWGVSVQLSNAPIPGSGGCMGCTTRGQAAGYFIGAAPEDVNG